MPKLARILNPRPEQNPQQLLRRLLRSHHPIIRPRLLRHAALHHPGMQQRYHDALTLQFNRQILIDLIERRLRRAVRVQPAAGVVSDGADAGGDVADAGRGVGAQDVGQQGLGEQQRAEGVGCEDVGEVGLGDGGEGFGRGGGDGGVVEEDVEGLGAESLGEGKDGVGGGDVELVFVLCV